ncbi:MAG: 3-oxoacyl-[Bacteroidales bacterium]|jgi:3-oxoacyl-[acyl-carrier protein] reductase|nr:3-oxoacyl-[acyl-carrier-protein] reductase [Bacteroidales bacterium]
MKLLENKIALITGAARGIGRRTAELFAEEGATVIFTDLKETDSSKELLQILQSHNPDSSFYTANAASWEETEQLAKTIIERYGRVDAIVNNAGITRDNLLLRMTPEDWDLVIQINLRSVFNYCKAFIPYMMKKRNGSIINTSSVVGVNGNGGQCNYAAAKAGIIGFTKSFAQEFGSRNIRCNAIAPGFIRTAMTDAIPDEARQKWIDDIPMRRVGTELDVARVSLFLASDLAEYVTGQVICVDGGISL